VKRIRAILGLMIPLIILYIVYTGSFNLFELILGIITAIVVGYLFGDVVVEKTSKVLDPVRWFWLVIYAVFYFTVIEAKAHWEVLKLIFNPSGIKPAIVRVPYNVSTDYALTTIANSITNTPGTITVDVDEKRKYLYVHWIKAVDVSDKVAKENISALFEKYAHKIFD